MVCISFALVNQNFLVLHSALELLNDSDGSKPQIQCYNNAGLLLLLLSSHVHHHVLNPLVFFLQGSLQVFSWCVGVFLWTQCSELSLQTKIFKLFLFSNGCHLLNLSLCYLQTLKMGPKDQIRCIRDDPVMSVTVSLCGLKQLKSFDRLPLPRRCDSCCLFLLRF